MTSKNNLDFSPLRDTGYGIGFHWATWTAPKTGDPLPFPEAVERFDVDSFVNQAIETGAGHVLITSCHQLQWFPGPNPEIEKILPGRTCKRDLLMEIADGLAKADIKLIVYYHHGTDGAHQDPEWWEACGAGLPDQSTFYDNYCKILTYIGEHYGEKITAYWFDAGYGLVARGEVPWKRMTDAARAGNPNRLICYNSGIKNFELYTEYQDYWAGEMTAADFRPTGELTPSNLYWYAFAALHRHPENPEWGEWGLNMENRNSQWPSPTPEEVADFINSFNACGGTVTLNLLCYQDGKAYAPDMEIMRQVKKLLR